MKQLGLIGGTSWHSTLVYYRLINEMVNDIRGAQENPPLIIHSINISLMRELNYEKIRAAYLDISRKLQNAGAEAIIICANTPHISYEYVQPKIDIPILHIADAIGQEASKLGMRRLGLLGNRPTMTGDFIKDILKHNYHIETFIPEAHCIGQAHNYISNELTQGIFSEKAHDFFLTQIGLLKAKGAEGIVLGCTELPMLIKSKEEGIPLLSTTHLHAKLAVDFILGKK